MWMRCQSAKFEEYGIAGNFKMFNEIARDISYLKTLEVELSEEVLLNVIDRAIVMHIEHEIDDIKDINRIKSIYKTACSALPACEFTLQDYKDHLKSKPVMYGNFHTEGLADVVQRIVSLL